jgi:hypothetical protein
MTVTAEYAARLGVALGWEWTAAQKEIVGALTRFTAISGGDRSGKSRFTARWLFLHLVDYLATKLAETGGKGDPRSLLGVEWIVAAHYEKTWQEFKYLEDDLRKQFPMAGVVDASSVVNPGLIRVQTPYGQVQVKTKSALDESSLVMEAPFAVAVVEAAQIPYGAYLRLQGRVSEKRAPILLAGSLEQDLGWYPSLVERWESPAVWATEGARSWRLPSHTNTFAYPLGEADPEILRLKRELPPNEYLRRHEGRPSPPKGLVHPLFKMAVHCRNVDFVPDETVYLGIDPGIAGPAGGGSAYAIVCCQMIEGQLRVFDLIHESDKLEPFIIEHMLTKRPWWGRGEVVGVIDRAGAARAGAHEASIEVYRKMADLNLLYTEAAVPIPDQIRRFDSFLRVNDITGEPGLVIDTKCEGLLAELGGTLDRRFDPPQLRAYQWNMSAQGELVGNVPRDRYNDAIKALSYLMIRMWGYATARGPQRRSIPVIRRKRERVYA